MPVNPEYEGRTFTLPEPHVVTADELAAFAQAVRSPSAHDAPTSASPTFAVSLAQLGEALFMRDPDAGVNFDRLVHAEQAFTHHAPIVAGDRINVTTTVKRIRNVGGNDMVTLVSELIEAGGEKRCTATSMMVIRGEAA